MDYKFPTVWENVIPQGEVFWLTLYIVNDDDDESNMIWIQSDIVLKILQVLRLCVNIQYRRRGSAGALAHLTQIQEKIFGHRKYHVDSGILLIFHTYIFRQKCLTRNLTRVLRLCAWTLGNAKSGKPKSVMASVIGAIPVPPTLRF